MEVGDSVDVAFDVCVILLRRLVTDHPTSFREQLKLFSTHGILVSPHGAGLTNAMFLAPFSSVIEIVPYHLDHNIYSTIAVTAGLGYYPVHTYNGSDVWSRYKVRCPIAGDLVVMVLLSIPAPSFTDCSCGICDRHILREDART